MNSLMRIQTLQEKVIFVLLNGYFLFSGYFSMSSALGASQAASGCKTGAGKKGCQVAAAPTASLAAQPASIVPGQSSTLTWSSKNAITLSLQPGIGTVAAQGSITVMPQQSTTYTLTATGSGGTVQATTVVSVSVPAPTATLSASPVTISVGGTSTLTWSSQNAASLDLEPGVGAVAAQGSVMVSPTQTTTYVLTAQGAGGTATASTTITTVSGIVLSPSDNIQDAVNANPAGTTFVLTPGVYRMQTVVPKNGDVFSGQSGAILDGAEVLTSWQQSSTTWVAQAQGITEDPSYRGVCQSSYPACAFPEDLFFDSQPLQRVASLASVGPGTWYFDYSAEKAYVGSNPSGHLAEISVLRAAFQGNASNVTIRNLTIQKYASTASSGAIHALSSSGAPSTGWIVDSNDLSFNHGMGLRISNGMQITNNKIHDNGQMGLGGSGSGVLVQNNEIYNNNYAGYSWGWEAGGDKFTYSTYLTIQGNYSHDNKGPGLWTDISNQYVTYDGNHTARNVEAGILHEISYNAIIRNNLIENDGFSPNGNTMWYGAGILISNSANVEVYGNTVTGCMNGIGGIQADRGLDPATGQPYNTTNLYVHDNTVSQPVNFAEGIVKASTFDNSIYTSWGNHFQNDTFNLLDTSKPAFVWLDQTWTLQQWNLYSSEH